jgi:hypothetical protein
MPCCTSLTTSSLAAVRRFSVRFQSALLDVWRRFSMSLSPVAVIRVADKCRWDLEIEVVVHVTVEVKASSGFAATTRSRLSRTLGESLQWFVTAAGDNHLCSVFREEDRRGSPDAGPPPVMITTLCFHECIGSPWFPVMSRASTLSPHARRESAICRGRKDLGCCPASILNRVQKCQQVGVDLIRMGGGEPVR